MASIPPLSEDELAQLLNKHRTLDQRRGCTLQSVLVVAGLTVVSWVLCTAAAYGCLSLLSILVTK